MSVCLFMCSYMYLHVCPSVWPWNTAAVMIQWHQLQANVSKNDDTITTSLTPQHSLQAAGNITACMTCINLAFKACTQYNFQLKYMCFSSPSIPYFLCSNFVTGVIDSTDKMCACNEKLVYCCFCLYACLCDCASINLSASATN